MAKDGDPAHATVFAVEPTAPALDPPGLQAAGELGWWALSAPEETAHVARAHQRAGSGRIRHRLAGCASDEVAVVVSRHREAEVVGLAAHTNQAAVLLGRELDPVVSANSSAAILPQFLALAQTGSRRRRAAWFRRPMLPLTFQFLIAMIAHAINERLARRIDYLQEEVRVVKEALSAATGKTRIALTDEPRRRWATQGKALFPEERNACCQIVCPSTILTWFRQLAAKKYDCSEVRRRAGRPRRANDIRGLVLRFASENPGGATPSCVTLFAA